MDDKFFSEVGRRLRELEAEKKDRFANKRDKSLFCHPEIITSMYWSASDRLITHDCFDWNPEMFPTSYLTRLRANPQQIHCVAINAYYRPILYVIAPPRFIIFHQANSEILVARILALGLERLLP